MAMPIQDSVRRMALISEQLYENLKANAQKQRLTESPEFTKARSLDKDISAILQNPRLSAYDKYQRYANTLKEFTLFHNLARAKQQQEEPTAASGTESLLQTLISMQQQQQQQNKQPVAATPVKAQLPRAAAPVEDDDEMSPPLPQRPPPPLEPLVLAGADDQQQQQPQQLQFQDEFSTPSHSPTEMAPPASVAAPSLAAAAQAAMEEPEPANALELRDIIETFTGKKKENVENLMGIISKYPDKFSYDKTTGQLVLSGKPVPKAELLPILDYVTAPKKRAGDIPEGTGRFLHQLQLIKDDLRPAIPSTTIRAAATPVFRSSFLGQGKKMKQSKLRVIRWEPY